MFWQDIVVLRELFAADCAFPIVLDNLSVQEFSAFLPVISVADKLWGGVDPQCAGYPGTVCVPSEFTATAEDRSVDWAKFIATEFHSVPPVWQIITTGGNVILWLSCKAVRQIQRPLKRRMRGEEVD